MLRAAALTLCLVLAAPTAFAGPDPDPVAIGPAGLADPGTPYYVLVDAETPRLPEEADKQDDCGRAGVPRPGPPGAAGAIVDAVLAWDPTTEPRISGWFPKCVATKLGTPCNPTMPCVELGYVAYDVTTGTYYVELEPPAEGVPLARGDVPHGQRAEPMVFSGSTGVAIRTDCEFCPPPGDLG